MAALDVQKLIKEYQTSELVNFHNSSFHLRKAFKPLAHIMEGDPTQIISPLELGFFSDTMHESSFVDSLMKLKTLNDYELVVLEQILKSMWENSKDFLQPCISINSILRHLYQYRLIEKNLSGKSSFLEIGPGSGYLPLFLTQFKPQVAVMTLEVTQSLYLYQAWLYHQFGVLIETVGNSSLDIASSLTSGKILHLPWWTFVALEKMEKEVEALIINHAICELHPYALDRILRFSIKNNCRVVLIEGIGLQKYFHSLGQIIEILSNYGFTEIQNLGHGSFIASLRQPRSTPVRLNNQISRTSKSFLRGLPFVIPFWRELKKIRNIPGAKPNSNEGTTHVGEIEAFVQLDLIVTRITGMNISQIYDRLYDHAKDSKGLLLNTHNSSKYFI